MGFRNILRRYRMWRTSIQRNHFSNANVDACKCFTWYFAVYGTMGATVQPLCPIAEMCPSSMCGPGSMKCFAEPSVEGCIPIGFCHPASKFSFLVHNLSIQDWEFQFYFSDGKLSWILSSNLSHRPISLWTCCWSGRLHVATDVCYDRSRMPWIWTINWMENWKMIMIIK